MGKRRVVVTGLGMVTPVGLTVEESWKSVLSGKSGVGKVDLNTIQLPPTAAHICASVKNFDATPFLNPKLVRKVDLFIQYGLVAAKQAIDDAKLTIDPEHAERYGVAIGSGIGGLPLIESSHRYYLEHGLRKVSPMFIPNVIINMLAGYLSIEYGMRGPNIAIVTACTTGTHNIGVAARSIAYGDADVMIAGGSEMATCSLGIIGFSAMRALSTRNDEPEKASRPWDRDRDGFILGDGAGVLVLEEYEHAKKRGAHIYAEVAGFGMSADAYHMTSPDPEGTGGMIAMKNALNDAQMNPEEVGYINAHATSTPAGDEIEIRAIKKLFGSYATKLPVSSTKSMTGHLLGAAGAVESIFSILALRDQVVPPTINLDNPAETCVDMNLVPHKAQEHKLSVAMNHSLGFGGTNGTVVFKKL